MDELDSYLGVVDELVEDENKIVTYKHLSQQLAVPIDKAKEILELYIKNSENGKVSAMYTITGRTKLNLSISVVSEENLDTAKSQLDTIFSCLPYSVQKAKLNDPSPLYLADYEMTKKILHQCASFSKIYFHGAKTLSEEEVMQRRFVKRDISADPTSKNQANNISEQKTKSAPKKATPSWFSQKGMKTGTKDSPSQSKTSEDVAKLKESPSQNKEAGQEKGEAGATKNTLKSTKSTKRKGGMDAFMTKGKGDLFIQNKSPSSTVASVINVDSTSSSTKEVKATLSLSDDELKELDEEMIVEPAADSRTEEKEKSPKEKETKKKSSKVKSQSKKSKSISSSNEQPAKKRKRIMELSSSSSSESEPEDQFDQIDVIPPSPVPQPSKGEVGGRNSRKKRVLKSRTFFDKDGSMLTEKVWEEESCSEEDEEIVKKENKTPPEAEKKPIFKKKPIMKGKQSSLMGFFKTKT